MSAADVPRSLVGQYVRLAHLPPDCKPTPLRVTEVTPEGEIRLEGRTGTFWPGLFVIVERPELAREDCSAHESNADFE